MKNIPSTEERVWAGLSHLSALAFGMGVLLPVIGWSEQRRKSNYASFQCLQALGYQSLGYTVWILFSLLMAILVVVVMALNVQNAENMDLALNLWMTVLFVLMFGLMGLYLLLPMVAGIACFLGKDFRYPLMGRRLANYLGYESAQESEEQAWLIEDHEDRWVAATGHFSVIVLLWGMLIPLMAWILQGKRSHFLKFQSVQTLVYQGGTLLLYFGSGFVYLAGFIVFLVTVGFERNTEMNLSMGIGLVVFAISMLITFLIILIVPLLHILGQWAGYRVLKGDDYRYPLVGRLVVKWLGRPAS